MRRACWLLWLCGWPVLAAAADSSLHDYVTADTAGYGWELHAEQRTAAGTLAELTLTSQIWHGQPWRHRLFVLRPPTLEPSVRHALLFIGGGRWDADDIGSAPPAELAALARLATLAGVPVALLRNVPQQPLFGGLTEDALIAHTFSRYLGTGDPHWPLLLPMTNSAVRALDAVSEYAAQAWGLELATFTVAGLSKRGWTTWLTAAVDARVTALAPMVFDILNMEPQIAHQRASWGGLSYKIDDYSEHGLPDQLQQPGGAALQALVDPYQYRAQLTQPKLIILGSNDPYWPLDALNLYWPDLPGLNNVLYLPNTGHDADDNPRTLPALAALVRHAAYGAAWPQPRWQFTEDAGGIRLLIAAEPALEQVQVWTATAVSRDFRAASWSAQPVQNEAGPLRYGYALARPERAYAALFAELVYRQGELRFSVTTTVRILTPESVHENAPLSQ